MRRLGAGILLLAAVIGEASRAQPPTAAPEPIPTLPALTATSPLAPVPIVGAGAPMLTPEDLRARGETARVNRENFEKSRAQLTECYMTAFGVRPQLDRMVGYDDGADAARRISSWSRLAETSTNALQQARQDVASGKASAADLEKVELDRQRAVIELVKADLDYDEALAKTIDLQQLIRQRVDPLSWRGILISNAAERARLRLGLVPVEYQDLGLEGVRAVQRDNDKGPPTLVVTGGIRNTLTHTIDVPPIAVTAVDTQGFPLTSEQAQVRGKIESGKVLTFSYAMRSAPPTTARVTVTFGQVRTPAMLEPAEADPVCQYHPVTPFVQRGARVQSLNGFDPEFTPDELVYLDPRTLGGAAAANPSGRVNIRGTRGDQDTPVLRGPNGQGPR